MARPKQTRPSKSKQKPDATKTATVISQELTPTQRAARLEFWRFNRLQSEMAEAKRKEAEIGRKQANNRENEAILDECLMKLNISELARRKMKRRIVKTAPDRYSLKYVAEVLYGRPNSKADKGKPLSNELAYIVETGKKNQREWASHQTPDSP